MAAIHAPIKYAGSKYHLMKRLVGLLPPHHTYLSVFGGSATDILGKPPSRLEIYNDKDEDLVNLFRVLQHRSEAAELCHRVKWTPYSRTVFEEAKSLLCDPNIDRVTRAWATLVCANQSWVGSHFTSPSLQWSYFVAPRHPPRWYSLSTVLPQVARRFSSVILECDAWERILDRYDSTTSLFYLDPPYLHCTRTGNQDEYRHELTQADHERLLERIRTLKGGVMLSGYDSGLYSQALQNWTRIEFPTVCSVSSCRMKPTRTEIVWTNCIAPNQGVKK